MNRIPNRPFLIAWVTAGATLLLGATLIHRANFGIPPAMALGALLFLCTIGLPTVLGVGSVATMWGHIPGLVGFSLFVSCAVPVALLFQYAACRLASRAARKFANLRRSE